MAAGDVTRRGSGSGPRHMGEAVGLQRVVILYPPGVQFFAGVLRSDFFRRIIGGQKLGDTRATITAPILDKL